MRHLIAISRAGIGRVTLAVNLSITFATSRKGCTRACRICLGIDRPTRTVSSRTVRCTGDSFGARHRCQSGDREQREKGTYNQFFHNIGAIFAIVD